MTAGARLFTVEEWDSFNPLYRAILSQAHLRRIGWTGRLRLLALEELPSLIAADFLAAAASYVKLEPLPPECLS